MAVFTCARACCRGRIALLIQNHLTSSQEEVFRALVLSRYTRRGWHPKPCHKLRVNHAAKQSCREALQRLYTCKVNSRSLSIGWFQLRSLDILNFTLTYVHCWSIWYLILDLMPMGRPDLLSSTNSLTAPRQHSSNCWQRQKTTFHKKPCLISRGYSFRQQTQGAHTFPALSSKQRPYQH